MHAQIVFAGLTLAALLFATERAQAFDDALFPDWKGPWFRIGGAQWDSSKPDFAQQAPFTPEYQAKLEANIASIKSGGQGNNLMSKCVPPGMPRMMLAYNQFEFVIFPDTTYIVQEHFGELRRIHTDRQSWPPNVKPTFSGYSIGQWIDENGDGRYDALRIETRIIAGPRAFDDKGLPLHADNETVVTEYIHADRDHPEVLRNEVTTIDRSLRYPWTVTRNYERKPDAKWFEHPCENSYNGHVFIGGENYFTSAEGLLMPTRKGQPAPDLRHFDSPK